MKGCVFYQVMALDLESENKAQQLPGELLARKFTHLKTLVRFVRRKSPKRPE